MDKYKEEKIKEFQEEFSTHGIYAYGKWTVGEDSGYIGSAIGKWIEEALTEAYEKGAKEALQMLEFKLEEAK